MSFTIKMSQLKYLDRKSSSRYSLTRQTSPSQLPSVVHRPVDSFTISLKKHLAHSFVNPEQAEARFIRYYVQNQLSACPPPIIEEIEKQNESRRKKFFAIQQEKEENWRNGLQKMKEKTFSQVYEQRVSENLKHYGNGMLRNRHRNSLSVASKESDLLKLHYRLKKEREFEIIRREQRKAEQKFKRLISQYETQNNSQFQRPANPIQAIHKVRRN